MAVAQHSRGHRMSEIRCPRTWSQILQTQDLKPDTQDKQRILQFAIRQAGIANSLVRCRQPQQYLPVSDRLGWGKHREPVRRQNL